MQSTVAVTLLAAASWLTSASVGSASDLAVTKATGKDRVFSLLRVCRKLAAMVLSASGLLKSPKAASEAPGAAKGLA